MKIERFEDLEIWKEARELNIFIRDVTNEEPFCKDFKFRDQFRSSAGSIMDKIAEGFERDGRKEFIQFLSVAKGSCGEARSQSYRAFDYGYILSVKLDDFLERTVRLSKKISRLISYLKSTELKGTKFKNLET